MDLRIFQLTFFTSRFAHSLNVSETSDASSDDFEKLSNIIQPALCITFPLELGVEAKAKQEVKENLWNLFFSDYGRGVSMYRTYRARELIMKGKNVKNKFDIHLYIIFFASPLLYKHPIFNVIKASQTNIVVKFGWSTRAL